MTKYIKDMTDEEIEVVAAKSGSAWTANVYREIRAAAKAHPFEVIDTPFRRL